MKSYDLKTILITGASRGIGEQLAIAYAAPGINLILIARNLEKLKLVSEKCAAKKANVIIKALDVRNARKIDAFIVAIEKEFPINLVIVNAGVSSTLQKGWLPENPKKVDEVLKVNLFGAIHTLNPIIANMIRRRSGQIAIISSIAGLRGLPQSPSYSASKAALYAYAQSLYAWLGRYNISVSVVCPGYVKTDMSDKLYGIKPLILSSNTAANIIIKGLNKRKFCVAFPKSLYLLTLITSILPLKWTNFILNLYESYIMSAEDV